jgi:hypothetical protein
MPTLLEKKREPSSGNQRDIMRLAFRAGELSPASDNGGLRHNVFGVVGIIYVRLRAAIGHALILLIFLYF